MTDLILYPFYIVNGEAKADLPGLLGTAAPRKAARSRHGDQLVIFLTLAGNAPLTPDGLKQLLAKMNAAYFDFPGSVTSALRAAADTANQYLLERNLRNTSSGRQSTGLLNLAAVHAQSLYLANSGPVYSLSASRGEKTVYHDPSGAGKGLGLSRTTTLRYYQCSMESGLALLLSADPVALNLPINQPETASRMLAALPQKQASFSAVLIQTAEGEGRVTLQNIPSAAEPAVIEQPVPAAAVEEEPLTAASVETSSPVVEAPVEVEAVPEPVLAAPREPEPIRVSPIPEPLPAPMPVSPRPARRIRPPEASPAPAAKAETSATTESVLKAVAKTVDTTRRARQSSARGLASFFSRLLPGDSGQPASLSPLTMAFIAVAVPVMVVAAALMVYFEKGRGQQYQTYYEQAVQAASLTQGQNDPAMLRNAWSQALYYLDKAETARPEQAEAFTLRQQAQQALDSLDGIARLDYQPAILGGLAPEINITSMAVSSSDLFMLDAAKGSVKRAILTGRGYEVDPNFVCNPGPYGSIIVGDLVDIAPMPRGNEFNASLLAVDGSGNLLFCLAGGSPISVPLGSPDNNWGEITAIAYESGVLYVLDPPNNAVWVFGQGLRDRPSNYFGVSIPPMSDVIDLAVNGDDVYLLHSDGRATFCTASYTGGYETSCTDPAPYTDPRPGRESSPVRLTDTEFTQMRFLPPPDPSLYILDSNSGAIYHFSLRLNLNRQLRSFARPADPFPAGKATAFAVGSNHMAYVAFGNQVFYGLIQ